MTGRKRLTYVGIVTGLVASALVWLTGCDTPVPIAGGTGGSSTPAAASSAKGVVEDFSKAVMSESWNQADTYGCCQLTNQHAIVKVTGGFRREPMGITSYAVGDEWVRGMTSTVYATWHRAKPQGNDPTTMYVAFQAYYLQGSWKISDLKVATEQPLPITRVEQHPLPTDFSNPKNVVTAFYTAKQNRDYATADQIYTAAGFISGTLSGASFSNPDSSQPMTLISSTLNVGEPTINGDQADVTISGESYYSTMCHSHFEVKNKLRKEGDKWRIMERMDNGFAPNCAANNR